jgi:capsular exopolysaccharide synthesis family protein
MHAGQRADSVAMSNQQRDFTISEYFGAIKRHRLLVVVIVLIAAGIGFGISAVQKKKYTAIATLTVPDPNQYNGVVGSGGFTTETQLQEASAAAPLVTRPAVIEAAKAATGSTRSVSAIQNMTSVAIDPNSFALQVSVEGPHPTEASQLANAIATADANLSTTAARASYAAQAKAVEAQLKTVNKKDTTALISESDTLAHLQNLAAVFTPLEFTQAATVPSSASSPKPLTDTGAALAIGLLLGIAAAIARDARDRRLRHVTDLTAQLDYPVVGHIPASALGSPGVTRKNSLLNDRDAESFRILRQNVMFLPTGEGPRILLVTSPMPQEGKSTVAAGLAIALAQAGRHTLLVECDFRRPVIGERFGLNTSPGLTDYLTGNAGPQQVLQRTSVGGYAPTANGNGSEPAAGGQLVCITGGSQVPLPAELLAADKFKAFLAEVGQAYDTVVLDTPPLLPLADTLGIVPQASSILLCARLAQTTRDLAQSAREALERLPKRPIALVVTAVRDQVEGYYSYYRAPAASGSAARV